MNQIVVKKTSPLKDFAIVYLTGKTYICPNWVEVPNGTERSDVKFVDTLPPPVPVKKEYREWYVESSKGDKEYIVRKDGNTWSCTCPATKFHRGDCKHIKQTKSTHV